MKKPVIVLSTLMLFSITLSFFQSCCNPDPVYFHTTSLATYPERIIGITSTPSRETGYFMVEDYVPNSSGIRYDSLGINIQPVFDMALNQVNWRSFPGISTAKACSQPIEYDMISDVVITSTEDYNDFYPAGSDLEEIMQVHLNHEVRSRSIAAYLTNRRLMDNYFFTFSFPPAENKNHDFTLTFELRGGRVLEAKVLGVLLNR